MSGTIKLSKKTKEKLKQVGVFGETYDDVVSLLVEMLGDFNDLLGAITRSDAEAKATASTLNAKYGRRIQAAKRQKKE